MRWEPLDAGGRRARLPLVILGWLGVAVLAVWDPVTQPGPALCGMRSAFALPCPACGLTRGLSRVVRGDVVQATRYNPLAVPAAAGLGGLLLLWTAEAASGRRLAADPPRWVRLAAWAGLWLGLLLTWLYLLAYRREDAFAASWLGRLLGV